MTPEIQTSFDAIERRRAALQEQARMIGAGPLQWRPAAEAWSFGQIVEHLVLSDETLGQAREIGAVANEPIVFRILPRSLRRRMVLRAFARNVVLPLPSPDVDPRGAEPLAALIARWDAARDAMRRDLDTMRGNEARYSHPILGPLTAMQMLELSLSHMEYHMRQAELLRAAAAFTKEG